MSGPGFLAQLWIVWVWGMFLTSIFFVKRHIPARWIFAAFLGSIWAVLNVWGQVRNIYLLGVAHLIIWIPLAFYIWDVSLSKKSRSTTNPKSPFDVWMRLLFVTIIIALLFDVRNIYLVIQGLK